MQSIIELIAENKTQAAVLAALTAIFTACATFVFHHYSTEGARDAAIRELTTTIEEKQAEFVSAARMVSLRDKQVSDYIKWTESFTASLTDEALSPPNINASTKKIIDDLLRVQAQVQRTRAEVAAEYFGNSTLKDVQSKLLMDLDQMDTFLSTRVEFLRTILSDRSAAQRQAEVLRHNMDGRRFGAEFEARYQSVNNAVERAKRVHNDEVAKANASLASDRLQGNLAVAASSYAGAYIGGLFGWALFRRRRRARAEDAPAASSTGSGLDD